MAANNALLLRPRLMSGFDELRDERIIFVSAPAGSGKTVAVMQWLERDARSRTILALDEYDNEEAGFCRRFSGALRLCQPGNGKLAALISHEAFEAAPREFAFRAIELLSARKRGVLVLDDLHLITDEKTLSLLLAFLKRLPKNIQTVLISRADLPRGFSDLWIKGQAALVPGGELAFSGDDVHALCVKRGKPVSRERAEEISRLTHGWAIGVNAFLLSGGEPDCDVFDYLDAFIAANIWQKWDEPTREFLLRTALLHDLDPALCDALTGRADSRELLNALMRGGAFITRTADGVYRCHHLFQSFLRRLLAERGEAFRFRLLRVQGEWHLRRHDFYSAADCFIRCRDHDGIARAFDLLQTVSRGDYSIERMLPIARNPEVRAAARKYPFILYTVALAAYIEGRADEMTALMDEYYARFPEIAARNPECAHNILYMLLWDYRVPLGEMLAHVDLSLMPPTGDVEGAGGSATLHMPFLHRSSIDLSELAAGDAAANIEGLGAAVGWLFGGEWALLSSTITAGFLYEKGELTRAHEHALAALAAMQDRFASDTKLSALAILAAILDAQGDARGADIAMARMSDMIERDKAYFLNRSREALDVSRKLGRGDIRAARSWLAEHAVGIELHEALTVPGLYEAFTTARACVVTGDSPSGVIVLKKILALSRRFNRTLDTIEALALLAAASRRMRGFASQAADWLEEAVLAARPCGYTQVFVSYGRELAGMLQRLWKKLEQTEDKDRELTGFVKMLCISAREARGNSLAGCAQEPPPVRYTEKQRAVMRLLCEGKTYKEMCAALGIKLPTLRSHIELIYKKLDVSNEIDAILRIQAGGLLE